MSKQHDGGPAFPTTEWGRTQRNEVAQYQTGGMSLRDYFAGLALSGMLGADGNTGPRHVALDPMQQAGGGKWLDPINVARQSYEIADAMLKAREL